MKIFFRKASYKLSELTSPIIRVWENYYFKNSVENSYQPIFIIGAPRTGSTILYQALTNAYQFAYIDNTVCSWHRNLRFGFWLSDKRYGGSPHNNFQSDHGNTLRFGPHAPSECGQFWYRWLPKTHHFVDYHEITEDIVKGVRNEVLGISEYLKKPILFKNLNAGQRLRLVHRCFPNAKIIFVRRDPRFVIRSILKARRSVGVEPHQWWSIMPKNIDDLIKLPEAEMCVSQVYYLEKQIESDISLFPVENVRQVHYQDFNDNLMGDLASWLGVGSRLKGELPSFRKDNIAKLKSKELAELTKLTNAYDFKKELFV